MVGQDDVGDDSRNSAARDVCLFPAISQSNYHFTLSRTEIDLRHTGRETGRIHQYHRLNLADELCNLRQRFSKHRCERRVVKVCRQRVFAWSHRYESKKMLAAE